MSLRPVAKGGALGLATLVIEKAAALLLVVGLARTLSPDDFGRYAFVLAYLTLFQVLADLGLEPILLRRLSQEAEQRDRWMSNALGLRILLAVVSAGLAVLSAPIAAPGRPDLRWPVAIGAAGLLFVAQPGFRALLRAEGRLDDVLRVALATNVALLGLVAVALGSGGGLDGVLLAVSTAYLGGFVLAGFVVRSSFHFRLAFEPAVWRSLLAESWPVGANVFAVMLGLRMAPILLLSYRGPVEVGFLTSAMRIAEGFNLVAEGLMLAVFPVLARLAVDREDAFVELARACAKSLAALLLPGVLIASQLAPDILGLLFGEEFRAAGPALAILGWFALLAALGTLYANQLVAVGRQRILFALNAVSALAQIALQFVLVPRFGLMGAATGAVLASLVNHVVLYGLHATARWIRPCVHAVLPLVGIGVSALALGNLVAVTPPVRAALQVGLFALGAVGTGALGRADIARLRGALAEE